MDQPVRDDAVSARPTCARPCACRPSMQPVTGGEAIVSAPAAGRFAADSLLSIGATVSAGQVAGPSRAAAATAATIGRRLPPKSPRRRRRWTRRARNRRAPSGCLPSAPCPRGASKMRDARSAIADARLRAAQARLAQRDQTLGTGGGAASGNAFVLRAPIAGRVAEVIGDAWRLVRRRCAALQDRQDRRSRAAGAGARRRRRRDARIDGVAFEIPGRAGPDSAEARTTCTTPA